MKSISIKMRLILLSGVSLLAITFVGLLGFYGMEKGATSLKTLGDHRLPSMITFMALSNAQLSIKVMNRNVMLLDPKEDNSETIQKLTAKRKDIFNKIKALWGQNESIEAMPQAEKDLIILRQAFPEWIRGNQQLDLLLDALSVPHLATETQRKLLQEYSDQVKLNAKQSALTLDASEKLVELNQKLIKQDYNNELLTVKNTTHRLLLLSGLAFILVSAMAFILTRSILTPLSQMQSAMISIERNMDFTSGIQVVRSDEIGQIALAFNRLIDTARKAFIKISDNASTLASAAEEFSAVSTQMSSNAALTANKSKEVSHSASEVSNNTQIVAAGVEEMGSSIREISINTIRASNISHQAAEMATHTNLTMAKLGESLVQIGGVLTVISSIAEQTKLLALNANIEAARAGEFGKGFSVVANEVKELARQTAKATQEIGANISSIQTDGQGAIDSIDEISKVVNQIKDVSNQIASAVEEQAATTGEMSKSVSTVASSTLEIASSISSVSEAAQSTTLGARHSHEAATELARIATELKNLVSRFVV